MKIKELTDAPDRACSDDHPALILILPNALS